jgi:DNA-binding transcriptional regulator YdaS (Cro superfamily)
MNAIKTACDTIGSQFALASLLGVSPGFINQWIKGRRPVPTKYCAKIENATAGKVTRRDLRLDDWWVQWPELVTDQFPAPVIVTEERRTDTSPPHVMEEKRVAGAGEKRGA